MVVLFKLHLLLQQEGIKLYHPVQIMIQSLEIKIKILSIALNLSNQLYTIKKEVFKQGLTNISLLRT